MKEIKTKKGFTIIEVVLVLAIAGLIFLMVFIALPALQRSQRDSQRRQDLSRVQSQLTNYLTNNRNKTPDFESGAGQADFIKNYMKSGGDNFNDPDGEDYKFEYKSIPTGENSDFNSLKHQIFVTKGAVCDGEKLITNQGSSKMAFQMRMEGGGIACVSN